MPFEETTETELRERNDLKNKTKEEEEEVALFEEPCLGLFFIKGSNTSSPFFLSLSQKSPFA